MRAFVCVSLLALVAAKPYKLIYYKAIEPTYIFFQGSIRALVSVFEPEGPGGREVV